MTDDNQLQRLLCRGTIFLALMLTAVPMALSTEALAADLGVNLASELSARLHRLSLAAKAGTTRLRYPQNRSL